MTPRLAAWIFAGLIAVVGLCQFALALAAPWGGVAMGGAGLSAAMARQRR